MAEEAAVALQSLGIPAGSDIQTRLQIINELESKGRDEFLREWVVQREVQMHKLEAEVRSGRSCILVHWMRYTTVKATMKPKVNF